MRFVAGRGAVAELLAGAPWRSCWPGRCGGAAGREQCGRVPSGRCCWPGRCGRAADRPVRSGKEAGRGTAMAKRQAGNAAVAKRLLAGAR